MNKKIFKNPVLGGIFFILFIFLAFFAEKRVTGVWVSITQLGVILSAGLALFFTFNFKKTEKENDRNFIKTRSLSMIMFLIIIPITILAGMYLFDNRRYYIMSLLVILEAIIPYFILYEKKAANVRHITVISIICAFSVIGRVIFFALPQFKPTAAIIMLSGICFGGETGFLCGAISAFLYNIYFGQGPWTLWQMLSMGVLGALAGLLTSCGIVKKNKLSLSVFGFLAVLVVYGLIMNTSGVISFNDHPTADMFAAAYIGGLPFDLVHAAGTAFFMWFISDTVMEKADRIILKYRL